MSDAETRETAQEILGEYRRKEQEKRQEVLNTLHTALPRVKFVCGYDGFRHGYKVGVFWSKRDTVKEGDMSYSKWFVIRTPWRPIWIDRN